jgi:hypothetical protein
MSDDGRGIEWELTYSDLNSAATQSHIHIGQRNVAGPISVFLCTNLGNAPAGPTVEACPPDGGTVSGTFSAAEVAANPVQGIDAGEFDDLVRAIRAGVTYVNVHTTTSPPGEIRGQIRARRL